jgi:MFS superfamily sulfate permease-like transporter
VAVGTLAAELMGLGIARVDLPELARSLRVLRPSDFGALDADILRSALAIAFIASAETLLCAGAVDQMHAGPRTRYDQELAAQGAGNLICGLFGGLPMTGVIVRSAANVEAGAKTRRAAVLHGLWLLLAVLLLRTVLERVPTTCLAAVLVYTGYKLMDPRPLRELWRHGAGEVVIFAATFAVVVATDLCTGVLVGLGLSALKLLHTFSHLSVRLERSGSERRTVLRLEGAATFVRLPQLARALESVDPGTRLHVHFEGLSYIDHACLDLFMNWEKQHEATGGRLIIDWPGLTARFHARAPRRARRAA